MKNTNSIKSILRSGVFAFFVLSGIFILNSCSSQNKSSKNIALFIPGIISDSPVYEMLKNGVEKSVLSYNEGKSESEIANVFVAEVGTNQAEWENRLLALASEQKYDVIISSNPSLPELAENVLIQFPEQKFILLDAEKQGNPNIATVCYNQKEQAYLTGYIAGLFSKTKRLALIAAQEYPVMNNVILPYFEKGAKDADKNSTVDFRIVGNWYDSVKGAEIADSVYKNGVDVILPICGGASQGVINSAVNNGIFITWFDNNGFSKAPGTIISSTIMAQEKMAMEITTEYLNGKTNWGSARTVGISEGFIDFVQDDPLYVQTVNEEIRNKMSEVVLMLKEGKLKL